MASSSRRKSGSSGRKRVVIGAQETVRVRYKDNKPQVETERNRRSSSATRPARKSARPKSDSARVARAGQRAAKAKRDERERRQRAVRNRRIAFGASVAAALVAVIWLLNAAWSAPVFVVDNVVVEGNSTLTADEVIELAAVPDGATLLRLPKNTIRANVETNPWITEATVSRRLPDTVVITVQERDAALVVDMGGATLWLVSEDGYWLGERSSEATGLVTVRDIESTEPQPGDEVEVDEVLNALALVQGLSDELLARTRVILAPTVDKTLLLTGDDVEIYVGEAVNVSEKDRIAREILEREQGRVVYINVRVVDRPTWRGL